MKLSAFSSAVLSAIVLQITSFGVVSSAPIIGQLINAGHNLACVPVGVIPLFGQVVCPPAPRPRPGPRPRPTPTPNPRPVPPPSVFTSQVLKDNPEMIAIAENDSTFTINPQTQAAIQKYANQVGDAKAGMMDIPSGTNRDRYEAFHRLRETTDNQARLTNDPDDKEAFDKIREWFARAQANYPNAA